MRGVHAAVRRVQQHQFEHQRRPFGEEGRGGDTLPATVAALKLAPRLLCPIALHLLQQEHLFAISAFPHIATHMRQKVAHLEVVGEEAAGVAG